MESTLTTRAHAKINLSLRVLGRRADGFHELRTIFQSVALHDTLTFTPSDGPFELRCRQAGVPLDHRNLVWRAAALVWDTLGRAGEPGGVSVDIRKRIPPQAGLAGGSANGAAALVTLARLWRVPLDVAALECLAARLGADVPYFLVGGTALGLGRGDEIHPLADAPRSYVVLALAPFGVSTAEAFGWYDEDEAANPPAAPQPGDSEPGNDLEGVVARRHPGIRELVTALGRLGATRAAMSGSGSTVFGLFDRRADAGRAAEALRAKGHRILLTTTVARREYARLSAPVLARRIRGGPARSEGW